MGDNWETWEKHVLESLKRIEKKQDDHDDKFDGLVNEFNEYKIELTKLDTGIKIRVGFVGSIVASILAVASILLSIFIK